MQLSITATSGTEVCQCTALQRSPDLDTQEGGQRTGEGARLSEIQTSEAWSHIYTVIRMYIHQSLPFEMKLERQVLMTVNECVE